MPLRFAALAVLAALLATAPGRADVAPEGKSEAAIAPAAEPTREPRRYLLDRLAAGASVGYFNSEENRVLSEIHFDFPFLLLRQKSIYVRGALETSTVKTGDRFDTDAFDAQAISYLIEGGIRDYLSNRVAIAAFVGLQGGQPLDGGHDPLLPGTASYRYVGFGIESAGFPRPGANRFEWRLAAGPTFAEEGVEGTFFVRGAFLWDILKTERWALGIDGSFDSLFDGSQGQTEYRVGPRWSLPLANGMRFALFAEWIRGQNPTLQIGQQGWNFGVRYQEGTYAGPRDSDLPDIRGVLTFGRGSDRGIGRFALDLYSPGFRLFGAPSWVFADLDANILGGTGTDTLYYIAVAGLEMQVAPRLVVGPRAYHRSNHTVGSGPTKAENLNIVQAALRTPGWDYADRIPGRLMPGPDARWYDRIEGIVAPGIVTGSTFTNARSWDVQAGARFDFMRRDRKIVPFARAFGEWGDVARREVSFGIATRQSLVLELQYRRDSQYLGDDDEDLFLMGSLFF